VGARAGAFGSVAQARPCLPAPLLVHG
jgi:hypothetical protein